MTTAQVPGPVAAGPVSVEVLDLTAPVIAITRPAHGAVFGVGQVVLADFTCTDDQPGPVDCDGPVDDGEAIDTTTPGAHTFTVTASDGAGNDATVTHIYTVAGRRPDGRIRLGANGATVGDGVYNLTGVGQTRTAEAARGATATFFVTIQNDGAQPEAFRLRGQPSTTNYAIRYYTGGVDITLPANNGTYQTPVVAPGATRTVKVVVTVGSARPGGQRGQPPGHDQLGQRSAGEGRRALHRQTALSDRSSVVTRDPSPSLSPYVRGVAQLGSAPALGAGGREFKSPLPDHAGVAQWQSARLPSW